MQSVKSKSNIIKKLLVGMTVLTLLLGLAATYAHLNNFGPFSEELPEETSVNYKEPTAAQARAGKDTKEKNTVKIQPKPGPETSSPATNSTPSNTVAVEITNEPKYNAGSLSVKTLIQEINSTGVCTLTLSKSGQTSVTMSAKTQVSGSVATCMGFVVDVSNIAKGTWNVRIDYKSNKSKGSTSEIVTV